jgi:UDP-N-acetylmuramoyl-L-alanyl-D-glutamate--2,6-diaminopimelate ligase
VIILKEILYKVAIEVVKGSTEIAIHKIEFDSRLVKENDMFVAIRGTVSDGHLFIEKAINLGAVAIVCDSMPEVIITGITYIQVKDTNEALAFLASNYYNNPSQNLKLVGITGTNGKTTIASLLYQLFKKAGYKVGLLSTVKIMVDEIEFKATHTTPDSLTINYYLAEMNTVGIEYCFMEVSSHGIHQKRTDGLQFAGGVFTNLSHDHLDYHPKFAHYRDVKKSFFDHLTKNAFALTNIDDKNGLIMLQNTSARKLTYALKSYADYKAQILENQLSEESKKKISHRR